MSDTVELSRNETYRGVVLDSDLVYPGWEECKENAEKIRDEYAHHLQALMDQYGIQDEAQLVSGHMVSIRNRISDGEKEDFSVNFSFFIAYFNFFFIVSLNIFSNKPGFCMFQTFCELDSLKIKNPETLCFN